MLCKRNVSSCYTTIVGDVIYNILSLKCIQADVLIEIALLIDPVHSVEQLICGLGQCKQNCNIKEHLEVAHLVFQ